MAKPGQTLARQLERESDRIRKLGYHAPAHELLREASNARRAQEELDYSTRERRRAAT